MNLYGYASNSPIDNIDPSGLFSFRSFADGIWSVLTEPINQAADIIIIGAVSVNNAVSDLKIEEDIQLRRMMVIARKTDITKDRELGCVTQRCR